MTTLADKFRDDLVSLVKRYLTEGCDPDDIACELDQMAFDIENNDLGA